MIGQSKRKQAEAILRAEKEAITQRYMDEANTHWQEYEAGWKPLREKYQAAVLPIFRVMQQELAQANMRFDASLSPVAAGKSKGGG